MIRISKMADYATVIMVYLAQHQAQLSNARTIAHGTHISVPTVSKIVKRLTQAQLLRSVRGAEGGYSLNFIPEEISVAQIISVIEQKTGLTECSMDHNQCSIQSVCHLKGNWRLINQAVEMALNSVSLAVLAKPDLQLADIIVN